MPVPFCWPSAGWRGARPSVDPRTLLITGGAGGAGSILIQVARRLIG